MSRPIATADAAILEPGATQRSMGMGGGQGTTENKVMDEDDPPKLETIQFLGGKSLNKAGSRLFMIVDRKKSLTAGMETKYGSRAAKVEQKRTGVTDEMKSIEKEVK